MKRLLCFFLLAGVMAAAAPVSPAQRTLKPEDFAALREVDEPNLSPDGSTLVYVVKAADLTKDKMPGNLWLAKWDGSENRALTFGEVGKSHPRWSPDGKWIAFLSGREDENEIDQLWILPSSGGEAEKVTETKGGVEGFAWAPDSTRLAVVVKEPDPRDPEKQKKEKKTVAPLVLDRFQFKEDVEGYLANQYRHLYLLDPASKKIEQLTTGRHNNVLPAWSPDGREIAFVSKRGDDPDRAENWDIFSVAPKPGAAPRQITATPTADPHPDWESAPAWSPDGKLIAFIKGGDPKKIGYAVHSLAVVSAAGGEPKILTATLDRNVAQPLWAADGKFITVVLEDDGAETLVRVPAEGGPPQAVAGGRRKVAAYDVSETGRTVVRSSTPDRPFEIYAVEEGGLRDLTKQNEAFLKDLRLARVEEIKAQTSDGPEIHSFVVHPLDERKRSPTLLRPHGGPMAQYAAEWSFEAQLFAAHGYAVLLPNPRGSTGRGEGFAMALFANWGGPDVPDNLAVVDEAIKRGIADPERLGVGGWSYGGMSTNYLIATTNRFKAATSGSSISNIYAGYGTDQYIRDYEIELGKPWENRAAWDRVSYPFFKAGQIKTPTLFLCGEADFNVPLLASEQMYQALRSNNVPTELVIYPDQHHRLRKPSYLIDRYKRYLEWYAKWIPGVPAPKQ